MKKLKSLTILAAVAAVFATVSCTKEDTPSVEPEVKISTITLSIEQPTDESATKTQLGTESSGSYPINWTLGTAHTDAIAVGTTSGDKVEEYTLTGGGGTMTGTFTGTAVSGAVKAFYPYADVVSAADGVYNVNIPAVQTYTIASSFGEDAMPMYAVASSTGNLSSMKPLMSVLKITLSGSCTVKRIVISNENEKLSGSATVTYTSESATLAFDETVANDYVELVCTDGVTLTSDGVVFHIVVPATADESTTQYTVRVVTDESKVMTKKFTPQSVFTAAKIKNLTNVLTVSLGDKVQYVEGSYCGDGIEITGSSTTTVWAPVNCGYDATNYTYGKLYQWGRKDGQGYDSSDATYPSGDNLVRGQTASPEASKFYYGSINWYNGSSPSADALWGATKTSYDPCPAGWRVPTSTELNALFSDNTSGWMEGVSGQNGFYFNGTSTCTSSTEGNKVFLPAAGCRYYLNGNARNRGDYGYYWSSSPYTGDANFARRLYFGSGGASVGDVRRAYGFSVRCVQE